MIPRVRKPSLIAHCDWSKQWNTRWMMVAVRRGDRWRLTEPERVEDSSSLLERLRKRCEEPGSFLVSFDFPIGLPVQYGELTGFSDFRHALREFGHGSWSHWYCVAEKSNQISVRRPFYPMRSGSTKQSQLLDALGFGETDDLLRRCEQKTDLRSAACMLFWTLGGNQVGKAAIAGWQEILAPNLDQIGLWPFDGSLRDLVQRCSIILVETYPGEVYRQLDFPESLSGASVDARGDNMWLHACAPGWQRARLHMMKG